jgi:hypothetical protein
MEPEPKPPRLRIINDLFGDLANCVATRKTRIVETTLYKDKYKVQFKVFWLFWKSYPEIFNTKKEVEDFIYDCIKEYSPLHNIKWPTE